MGLSGLFSPWLMENSLYRHLLYDLIHMTPIFEGRSVSHFLENFRSWDFLHKWEPFHSNWFLITILQVIFRDIWRLLLGLLLDDVIIWSQQGFSNISNEVIVVQKCTGPGGLDHCFRFYWRQRYIVAILLVMSVKTFQNPSFEWFIIKNH